jgi:GT2 family glycosyltransferase
LFFSIIIPTCNRNESLSICLENLFNSIQELSLIDCEVIITDDGNLSQAKSIIDEKFKWARWIAGPKKGPAANRNNGAKHAIGTWLIFLDDDCIPNKNLLSSYLNAILTNTTYSVIEGSIHTEGERKSALDYAPVNLTGGHLWSCNFCVGRNLFLQLDGFDEKFIFPHLEDIDFADRIKTSNHNIFFEKNAIVIHPWRKLTDGKKLAQYQEMHVYYYIKKGLPLSYIDLLKRIVVTHSHMLRKSLFQKDFIKAIVITLEHVFFVSINYNNWKKKYANKY